MTKISVITVVYNAENEIESTIKSVIEQSYDNIEFIIVDGNSTDHTPAIIRQYLDSINILITESDEGIYDAMNKGLNIATGDWILFLNAGDVFYSPTIIEQVVSDMKKIDLRQCAMVGGDVMFEVNGKRTLSKTKSVNERWVCMPSCHQSLLFKTEIHKLYPYDLKYKICADHDLFIKLFKNGYKFIPINRVISIFKFDGVSAKQRINLYSEKLHIAKLAQASFLNLYRLNVILLKLRVAKLFRELKVMK